MHCNNRVSYTQCRSRTIRNKKGYLLIHYSTPSCPSPQAEGFGISSIARFFIDFGYEERDELIFPAKKLRALWFAPPQLPPDQPPLPRIFISELKVGCLHDSEIKVYGTATMISGCGLNWAGRRIYIGNCSSSLMICGIESRFQYT